MSQSVESPVNENANKSDILTSFQNFKSRDRDVFKVFVHMVAGSLGMSLERILLVSVAIMISLFEAAVDSSIGKIHTVISSIRIII